MNTAATGVNFRPLATCCDISAKSLEAPRNHIVQIAEQSSPVPLPVMGILSRGNANHAGRRIHNHSRRILLFHDFYGHQRWDDWLDDIMAFMALGWRLVEIDASAADPTGKEQESYREDSGVLSQSCTADRFTILKYCDSAFSTSLATCIAQLWGIDNSSES